MKYILIVIFTFISVFSFAQKKQNVYYYKNNGKQVTIPDSADFVRIIKEPDLGSTYFNMIEYYPNSKIKREGSLSAYTPRLVFEGKLTSYFETGILKSIMNYKSNRLDGEYIYNYANGNLYESRFYFLSVEDGAKETLEYKTTQVGDSLGRKFLDDKGTGTVDILWPKGNKDYGNYVNGLKEGTWTQYIAKTKTTYEDQYKNGVFVKGKCIVENGESTSYNTLDAILPSFKGGVTAFGDFLNDNLIYPKEAVKLQEEGKVYLNFKIDIDGSLKDIRVARSVSFLLDKEAVRVMKLSPNWEPGMQRGRKIQVTYTIPIVFQLNKK
jgi:TonB family protein